MTGSKLVSGHRSYTTKELTLAWALSLKATMVQDSYRKQYCERFCLNHEIPRAPEAELLPLCPTNAQRREHHALGLPSHTMWALAPGNTWGTAAAVLGPEWSLGTSGMGRHQPWDVAWSVPTCGEGSLLSILTICGNNSCGIKGGKLG